MNDMDPEAHTAAHKPTGRAEATFRELLDLVVRLRSPEGCPWDRSRTPADMARYLLDEAYEVIGAIDAGSPAALKEELGDLLFQILFIARMSEEVGEYDIAAVLGAIAEKMIRRHPHVFGDTRAESVEAVRRNWERIKRDDEGKGTDPAGLGDGIPRSLPTLTRAQRIAERAAERGFDWEDTAGVLKKVEEEIAEFRDALARGDRKAMADEAGDLLFTLVNLCRFAGADAEAALRGALGKFTGRFALLERELTAEGKTTAGTPPAELDRLWNEAKKKPHEGTP